MIKSGAERGCVPAKAPRNNPGGKSVCGGPRKLLTNLMSWNLPQRACINLLGSMGGVPEWGGVPGRGRDNSDKPRDHFQRTRKTGKQTGRKQRRGRVGGAKEKSTYMGRREPLFRVIIGGGHWRTGGGHDGGQQQGEEAHALDHHIQHGGQARGLRLRWGQERPFNPPPPRPFLTSG